jgi:hypothetical protein
MKKSSCIIFMIALPLLMSAQVNKICNFHFDMYDEGKSPPTDFNQVEKMSCWERQTVSGLKSPDWFYVNTFFIEENLGSGYVAINGAENTNGYVGMLPSEAIYGDLTSPMEKNKLYSFGLKIRRFSEDNQTIQDGVPYFAPNYESNTFEKLVFEPSAGTITIEISFSINKMEPLSASGCGHTDGYKFTGDGIHGHQTISKTINLDDFTPGKWHQIEFDPFIADKKWEFIAVQTRIEPDQSNNITCRETKYLLLDDLLLRNPCNSETFEDCSYTSGSLSSVDIGVATNSFAQKITLTNVENANRVLINATPTASLTLIAENLIYECPNGWVGDLEIDLDAQQNLISAQFYTVTHTSFNDFEVCRKSRQILWSQTDNLGPQNCPCRDDGIEKNCCVSTYYPTQYYPNCQGSSSFEISAIDHLFVGVNSPFHVITNTHSDFIASESIIFGNQFKANSTMIAEVKPCSSTNKTDVYPRIETSETKIESFSLFDFYPNPNSGFVTFENRSALNRTITLYNLLGKVVKESELLIEQDLTIDFSQLSNGTYLVHFSNGLESEIKKMVVTK